MIGDISDRDIESPARAELLHRRTELTIARHIWRATVAFLADVRRMTLARSPISQAAFSSAWTRRVEDEIGEMNATDDARAFVASALTQSAIPDEAYDLAVEIVAWVATQGGDRDLLDEAVTLAFTPEDEPEALTAAARRFSEAALNKVGSAFDDLVLGGTRTPGEPVEPPSWLPTRGDKWAARVARDARTVTTSLQGSVTLRRMRSAGRKNKRWNTQHDDRVRSSHSMLDGMSAPIDQPFMAADGALMFPGDRTAPIGEWINCRCFLTGLRGARF